MDGWTEGAASSRTTAEIMKLNHHQCLQTTHTPFDSSLPAEPGQDILTHTATHSLPLLNTHTLQLDWMISPVFSQ